jgi:hypothetical protein
MPSPQGANAMTNKIAEIAVFTAGFVLCSSSLAPAYPRHRHHEELLFAEFPRRLFSEVTVHLFIKAARDRPKLHDATTRA